MTILAFFYYGLYGILFCRKKNTEMSAKKEEQTKDLEDEKEKLNN